MEEEMTSTWKMAARRATDNTADSWVKTLERMKDQMQTEAHRGITHLSLMRTRCSAHSLRPIENTWILSGRRQCF
jgi:hypothetical protein